MKLSRALALSFLGAWVFSISPRVISRFARADQIDAGKASGPTLGLSGFAEDINGRGFGRAIPALVARARASATAVPSAAAEGNNRLVRIEVTRKYGPGDWLPASSYQPGTQVYGPDQRSFPLGWDFRWGDNKANANHAMSEVTLTQLPTTVAPWVSTTLVAHMRGEWNTTGYGNARSHLIRLTGAAGESQWEYGGDPTGTYQGEFDTSNKMATPKPDGNRLVLTVNASLRFGDDHAGDMEIRLIYEPGGAAAGGRAAETLPSRRATPEVAPEVRPSPQATPEVIAVDPSQARRGSEVDLRMIGRNFFTSTSIGFLNPAIRVVELIVSGSTQISAHIQIPRDALVGTTSLYVYNPGGRRAEVPFTVIGEPTLPPTAVTRPVPPTPPAPAAAAAGLVAWWRFDEGGGKVAHDSSGNGNDATLMRSPSWVAGKIGKALSLNGDDDYVATEVDVQPSAMPSTTWTAWVYPTRVNYKKRQLILSDNDGGNDRSVLIAADTAHFAVLTGTGVWVATSVEVKRWQHIAVVYTPSGIEFYKNGIRYPSGQIPRGQESHFKLQIGRNPGFGEYFEGLIDEVRIYNRALSAAEIQAIYNSDLVAGRLVAVR